jgi:glycosyltransferase involved in cell wall biosynthesis
MIKKTILWWGRFDPNYSRNRIIRKQLNKLNYEILDFQPLISRLGYIEALLKNFKKTDYVWVPCFRQRDILSASRWCLKKNIKLIIDPLISSWDKQTYEKEKSLNRRQSNSLKKKESILFNKADIVLADTNLHANLFEKQLNVDKNKIFTLYVGAEEKFFNSSPSQKYVNKKFEILFYGSFLNLHGSKIIIEAAKLFAKNNNVKWTMLGDGPDLKKCKELAQNAPNIFFEKEIEYTKLASRIKEADLLLGIFGKSNKAGNVIPNKVFQALSCGKTVITRKSNAYPKELLNQKNGIIFIQPDNPKALYNAVLKITEDRKFLRKSNAQAKIIYDTHFSEKIINEQLKKILKLSI